MSSRAVAEAAWGSGGAHVQSTATRCPRTQAVRARGASLLPFCLPTQPSLGAPWARGLLSAFWERGSPDLPACGLWPAAWLKGGPGWPIFINTNPRPSRGAKPRGADDAELPQARPHQAGSRGGGEFKAGYLTRCRMTQAMTTKGASRAPAAQCPPFLFGAKGASAGESIK